MYAFIAILQHDLCAALNWQNARRTFLVFLLLAAAAVMVSWPTSYPFAGARPPSTLLWWGYINTYLIGRVIMATAAHTTTRRDDILPHEWSRYGKANAFAILIAKVTASLIVAIVWMSLSLPILLTARLLSPAESHLGMLHIYWLALAVTLSVWSAWFATLMKNRDKRTWLLNSLWLIILAAPLLFRNGGRYVSPVAVVELMIPSDFALMHATEVAEELLKMTPTLAAVTLIGALLAITEVNRWRKQAQDAPYERQ